MQFSAKVSYLPSTTWMKKISRFWWLWWKNHWDGILLHHLASPTSWLRMMYIRGIHYQRIRLLYLILGMSICFHILSGEIRGAYGRMMACQGVPAWQRGVSRSACLQTRAVPYRRGEIQSRCSWSWIGGVWLWKKNMVRIYSFQLLWSKCLRKMCACSPGQHLARSSIWLTAGCVLAMFNIEKPLDKDGKPVNPPGTYSHGLARWVC